MKNKKNNPQIINNILTNRNNCRKIKMKFNKNNNFLLTINNYNKIKIKNIYNKKLKKLNKVLAKQ